MKKSTKWIVIVSGIIAVLIIGALVAGTIIRHKIERELSDMKLGDIRLTTESVSVNLFRKTLNLKGIQLKTEERKIPPDSLLDIPIQYLDARFNAISLKGIRIGALLRHQVDFATLSIESPNATIVTRQIPRDTLPMHSDQKTALTALERIGIDNIRVTDGVFRWQQITESDTIEYRVNGLNVQVDGLQVDSTRTSREYFLYSQNIRGSADSLLYTFGNRSYILALDSLDWSYSGQTLTASHIELRPQYSKRDFPRKSARKSDYMQFDFQRLSLSGVDFDRMWNRKELFVDSIYVADGHFVSYKDRNAVVPTRVKPMIHQTIQDIPVPLHIDKIRAEGVDATYEELAQNGVYAGVVTFNNIHATFFGFTNIVSRSDQYIELYARSRVNGKGELTAVVSMPVDPGNDYFEAKATLKDVPMTALNQMVTPLARMEIESGHIDQMDYTMKGNSHTAQADMVLQYHGLKISVVKREDGEWRRRSGISNLANLLVIQDQNPDKQGLRTAHKTVVRDPYRSAFNYLWKGISAGAMETAETGTAKALLGN